MMTVLIGGKLVAGDPEVRTGKNGQPYTTAKFAAVQDDGERVLVSVIAFNEAGEKLARLKKADDIVCSGRASVSAWLDKTTGEPKAGVRIVAEHILSQYELAGRRKPKAEEGSA